MIGSGGRWHAVRWVYRIAGAVACVVCSSVALSAQNTVSARPYDSDERRAMEMLLTRKVTVDLRGVPRKQALAAIAASAQVPIQFRAPLLDKYPGLVTIQVKNATLDVALEIALAGTRLHVEPDGAERLFIVESEGSDARDSTKTGTVIGVVVDSSTDHALSGVLIQVQGTQRRILTDKVGRFTLREVPAGAHVIAVRLFGYRPITKSVEVTEDVNQTIRVRLTPVATVLSGTVTTATGIQRRLEVGNNIYSVHVDSILANAPVQTVTDLLETRVPALTVVHTTGQPGDPARLRLRGIQGISGSNAPIVVVDGVRVYSPDGNVSGKMGDRTVSPISGNQGELAAQYGRPSPLDQIDPNSIETIDVLPGPSASALYGSDAANGAIVITSKRGRAGTTHWSVAITQGTSTIPGKYTDNTYTYAHTLNGDSGLGFCAPGDFTCVVDSVKYFQALNEPRLSPLGRGWSSGGTASISGGSSSLLYSFTGSGTRDDGLLRLPPFLVDRYTQLAGQTPPRWMRHPDRYQIGGLTSVLTAQLSPGSSTTGPTTLTLSNTMSTSEQRRSSLGLGQLGQIVGVFIDTTEQCSTSSHCYPVTGVVRVTSATQTKTTGLTFNWPVRSWLPLNVTAGINTNDNDDQQWSPANLPAEFTVTNTSGVLQTKGQFIAARGRATDQTLNAGTIIPLNFIRQSRLEFATGINFHRNSVSEIEETFCSAGVCPASDLPFSLLATGKLGDASATHGWYVEPRIALPGGQYITPGFRLDGGGASGQRAGLTGFPKLSTSWVLRNMDEAGGGPSGVRAAWLSLLRVRGAFGYAGVQPTLEQRERLFTLGTTTLDGGTTSASTISVSTLGNTRLQPERSIELETGFDADAFEHRVSITATTYYKRRIDAILDVPVAASAGGGTQSLNIGKIRNTGVELTGHLLMLDSRQLQWGIDVNGSKAQSRVLSLAPGVQQLLFDGDQRVIPGYPLFGVWARPIAVINDANQDGHVQTGEIRLADSVRYIGGPDPDYRVAMSTNIGLFNHRVTFAATFDYQDGMTQLYGVGQGIRNAAAKPGASLFSQALYNLTLYATPDRTTTNYYQYQTVNTLRLNSMSLNYILPVRVARVFHGSTMSVALQGSNVYLRTNYRGKDPNVNALTTGNAVQDLGQLPQPRTWQVRVSLSQ